MKILTNKKINEIDSHTTRLNDIVNDLELPDFERDVLLGNINWIRSACDLPRIIRFHDFISIPNNKQPKEEECKHVFEIGFYENSKPFLFCKHCAKIIDLPIKKANPGAAIKKYCKREKCIEDCNKCPYPLKEIIRGDLAQEE